MNDLSLTAHIGVTDHALERARERIGWGDHLVRRIRGEIRVGIIADRVARVRPNWTRGTWNGKDGAPGEVRYVWDAEVTRCWVVAAGSDRISVLTLLLGKDEEEAAQVDRHLRRGMVRR